MAQWASTRPDLFPDHLTHKLEKLQDNVGVQYPFVFVENTMTTAFGSQWRNLVEIDETPIGIYIDTFMGFSKYFSMYFI